MKKNMNEKKFKSGVEKLKQIRMTESEKSRLYKNILNSEAESPFVQPSPFSFSSFHFLLAHRVVTMSLILVVSFTGLVYASDDALPGEALYSMKVSMLEPMLDQFNYSVEKRIEWEEEKVERRLQEAEALVERDELDEKLTVELEERVEKSSRAFATAVEEEAKLKSEDPEERKQKFRNKINKSEAPLQARIDAGSSATMMMEMVANDASSSEPELSKHEKQKEKVEKLRRKALESIEVKDVDGE
jgi:hypothetical protein